MTVSSATDRAAYTLNGVAQIFAVPFYFLDDTHLLVQTIIDGVTTTLVLGTDYTVSGANNTAGGDITTLSALNGGTLTVKRQMPFVQLTDYPPNTPFPSDSHERALDYLTMCVQQLSEAISRALTVPDIGTPVTAQLPAPQTGSLLGWGADASGNPAVVNAGASGVGPDSIVDANIAPAAAIGAAKLSYTAVGTGAVARTVAARFADQVSVLDFGADPTGVADSTAAFKNALASSSNVFVPPGTYVLSDAVSLGSGKRLFGAGRHNTILRMPSTFNAAALGCLVFTGAEPGPEIEGLCFIQDQPDSVTPTVYPPVIYAQNIPRFAIRKCRIACVYFAIDMKQNCGGALIEDVEMSALHVGIDIDGAQDIVRINKLHYWPFGGSGAAMLTTNQRSALLSSYGIHSGRCDGLSISDSIFLGTRQSLVTFQGASGPTFGCVSCCDFDTNGGLVVGAGEMYVQACTFSLGDVGSFFANCTGGTATFTCCNFICTVVPTNNGFFLVSGGSNVAISCCAFRGAALDSTLILAVSGSLVVAGCFLLKSAGTYTRPLIWYSAGVVGAVTGCYASPGTSGVFVRIDSDSGVAVTGNLAPNWSVTVPAASALTNTLVTDNLGGSGVNREAFCGYFSSDAVTTVKLPAGWAVSRLGTGNYSITHSLGLSNAKDVLAIASCDNTAAGAIAVVDVASATPSTFRVRTYAGATATDCGVSFTARRFR